MPDIEIASFQKERPECLRLRSVMERTGLSRTTIYRLMAMQKFPRQVSLAERAVGWAPLT